MTLFRATCFSLLFAASASTASAQLVVLGEGAAAQCYRYAIQGNQGSHTAIKTCTEAFGQGIAVKDRAATHVNRGILLMRKEKHTKAIKDYKAALKLRPKLTEAHVNLGAALIHLDELDDALIALNTALEDETSDTRPAALVNRAILYDRQEKYNLAYRDLKAADLLKPDWDMIDNLLARYTLIPKT